MSCEHAVTDINCPSCVEAMHNGRPSSVLEAARQGFAGYTKCAVVDDLSYYPQHTVLAVVYDDEIASVSVVLSEDDNSFGTLREQTVLRKRARFLVGLREDQARDDLVRRLNEACESANKAWRERGDWVKQAEGNKEEARLQMERADQLAEDCNRLEARLRTTRSDMKQMKDEALAALKKLEKLTKYFGEAEVKKAFET